MQTGPTWREVYRGLTQARNAAVAAMRALERGADLETTLRDAKATGAFSGPIRRNLLRMLEAIGLTRLLGFENMTDVLCNDGGLVHLTSALRYPVFHDGKNYSGTPSMLRQPMLRGMIERLQTDALLLPLGPQAAAALDHLVSRGALDPHRVLPGLPQPHEQICDLLVLVVQLRAVSITPLTDLEGPTGQRNADALHRHRFHGHLPALS